MKTIIKCNEKSDQVFSFSIIIVIGAISCSDWTDPESKDEPGKV